MLALRKFKNLRWVWLQVAFFDVEMENVEQWYSCLIKLVKLPIAHLGGQWAFVSAVWVVVSYDRTDPCENFGL